MTIEQSIPEMLPDIKVNKVISTIENISTKEFPIRIEILHKGFFKRSFNITILDKTTPEDILSIGVYIGQLLYS